jgi:hypothetical protein
MEILLNAIILGVVLGLLTNLIFKWLPPDKPTAVVAAAVLIIICVLLALNQILNKKENPCSPGPCPQSPPALNSSYEIVEHGKAGLTEKISKATVRVYATGIMISSLEPMHLKELVEKVRKNPDFKVKLVMLKPDGEALKLRSKEEEGNAPNRFKIAARLIYLHKLIEDQENPLSQNEKDRIAVKYIDVYPTISVTIIDNDLYAYFYPYNAQGLESPVIIFRDFKSKEDKIANFFETHFNNIEREAQPPKPEDYANYEKMVSLNK